jgi:hypothetical protein
MGQRPPNINRVPLTVKYSLIDHSQTQTQTHISQKDPLTKALGTD